MLTFEKDLKVFQAYLDDDPLYEGGSDQPRLYIDGMGTPPE